VIGTNKSDAAETVRSLLADLTGQGDGELPRAGMLRFPETPAGSGERPPIDELLQRRAIRAISYEHWLAIEAREVKLAAELGRGERVKLPTHSELLAACDDVARL
jgi:ferredoxin--NADP+ reductase